MSNVDPHLEQQMSKLIGLALDEAKARALAGRVSAPTERLEALAEDVSCCLEKLDPKRYEAQHWGARLLEALALLDYAGGSDQLPWTMAHWLRSRAGGSLGRSA